MPSIENFNSANIKNQGVIEKTYSTNTYEKLKVEEQLNPTQLILLEFLRALNSMAITNKLLQSACFGSDFKRTVIFSCECLLGSAEHIKLPIKISQDASIRRLLAKTPGQYNSTDVGSNPGHGIMW